MEMAAALKQDIAGDIPLAVHWDGKLLADLSGKEHVDRLPVIVNRASAIIQALNSWNVKDWVVGMCFDTTSSNRGIRMGACTVIETMTGRDLLHLVCRHHIMELVDGAAVTASLRPSSAPEVLLFKGFQRQWSFIDQTEYHTGANFSKICNTVKQEINNSVFSKPVATSVGTR